MLNLKVCGVIAGIAFLLSFILGLISRISAPALFFRPFLFAVIFFIISAVINTLIGRFLPELLEEGALQGDDGFYGGGFAPGSQVDITEGDFPGGRDATSANLPQGVAPSAPKAVFLGAQPDNSENGLGNISELLSKRPASALSETETPSPLSGMDQNEQDDYTNGDVPEEVSGDNLDFGFEPIAPSMAAPSMAAPSAMPTRERPGSTGMPAFFDDLSDSGDLLPDLDSMAGAFVSSNTVVEPEATEYSVSTPARKPLSSSKAPEWSGDFNPKDLAKGIQTALSKDKEG